MRREATMRLRVAFSLLLLTAIAGSANAQRSPERGGVRTETMTRMAGDGDRDLIWNKVGLLGLLGLLGFRQGHPDDSYHPASVD
jgi:hypothetical protein